MNEKILIIDDETNIRLMVKLALEASGYRTAVAADGAEGLSLFGNGEDFDLVLLDQRMPGMPGIEVQREIYRRDPGARLILITAFGTIDTALEAIKAGASDFMRKPFTAETLRHAVAGALARPRREKSPDCVPVGMVCREFTRTTINGFSFELISRRSDDEGGFAFSVSRDGESATEVRVTIPRYVKELALAHADADHMPGGERFWQAMAEEALANYLWQHIELPPGNALVVDDLTASLQTWIHSMTTVNVLEHVA